MRLTYGFCIENIQKLGMQNNLAQCSQIESNTEGHVQNLPDSAAGNIGVQSDISLYI